MAQELRSHGRSGGRFVARGQCCDALLFFAELIGLLRQNVAPTFLAGAGPAAPDEKRRGLDFSGRGHCGLQSAYFVSAYRARRSTHAERPSGTESVQPPSAILLTFLRCQS